MGTRKCDDKQIQSSIALVQQKLDASGCIPGIIIPVIYNFVLSWARSEKGSWYFCYHFVICYFLIFWYKGSVFKCE